VEVCQGKIILNGQPLPEKYLSSSLKTPAGTFARECQKIPVPADQYFVMGDNRTGSSDSREWGFVPRNSLIGKSRLRYWPPERWGTVSQIE
jgi:signal peptidase I